MNETLLSRATDKELIVALAERLKKTDSRMALHTTTLPLPGGTMTLENGGAFEAVFQFNPNNSVRLASVRLAVTF